MWRTRVEERGTESRPLEEALAGVFRDAARMEAAERQLIAAAAEEPIIADAYLTPQSPPHHAEGPFMDAHLRRMLATLAAVGDGSLRLADIEEFRRLRHFEGEIDELEQAMRERQSLFEAFILCHDAAKFSTAACVADPGTRGAELGFSLAPSAAWDERGAAERSLLRRRFADLFHAFASERRGQSPEALEAAFFDAYGIRVHYAGHDRMMHAPAYRALLERVAGRRRLPETDIDLLEDLIAYHLQPLRDFSDEGPSVGAGEARPERIARYVAVAHDRGWDADDFLDLLQACVFLDYVAGARRRERGRAWQDAGVLVRFLVSEHAHAPEKRVQKNRERAQEHKRQRQNLYRQAGLDGLALLDLFKMEPGPAFGRLLARVYDAAEGRAPLPALPAPAARELARRLEAYAQGEKSGVRSQELGRRTL